jgi:hypothetical protein
MPEAVIAKRGGVKRWRSIKTKSGRVLKVAVVRKKGPRGGSTVAWPAKGQK